MTTIQVRDVPDDVHRAFRRRAAEVQRRMADEGADGYATVSAADIVGRDRASN